VHTRKGAIGSTLRTSSPNVADLRASTSLPPMHSRPVRYTLQEPDAHAPWTPYGYHDYTPSQAVRHRLDRNHCATHVKQFPSSDNVRELRQRHASIRRFLPRGGHPPAISYHTVHCALHGMVRPARHSRRYIGAAVLLRHQQVFSRPATTTNRGRRTLSGR
jgi:hypothetical protein